MCDLLPVTGANGHLVKEWSSGFHAAVGMVRREEDAIDTDCVRHTQIGLVRQTPALVHRAGLLICKLTTKNSAVEVLPQVFLDGPLQAAIFMQRKSVVRAPRHPTQCLEVMTHDDLQRWKAVKHPAKD